MKFSVALLCLLPGFFPAQTLLPQHPKFDAWKKAQGEINTLDSQVRNGLFHSWSADSKFVILSAGKAIEVSTGKKVDYKEDATTTGVARRRGPSRGRQYTEYPSPDNKYIAKYIDNNVVLHKGEAKEPITADGSTSLRIKYGSASWVYGEELNQNLAMWWSADSSKLVFYRFDESKTLDYYVTLGQGQIQNKLYPEAYPKAGASNPTVKLFVYDVSTKTTTEVDTTLAGSDPNISEYIYEINFAPDGKTLLFYRTNRQQNVLELCAADLQSEKSKVIFVDEHRAGWVNNSPSLTWLKDGRRFLWLSERNGFANVCLSSLDTNTVTRITQHKFEVQSLSRVDEDKKEVWYTAYSGSSPYAVQLHRMGLDGKNDVCLTDVKLSHSIRIAPDGNSFTDVAESLETVRRIAIKDRNGKTIKSEIETVTASPYAGSKYQTAKRFVCKAADGTTDIFGYYQVPSDFDATRKYPVILRVYGGPESGTTRDRFIGADATCELGFITAWIDGRGTQSRGRDFRQSVYKKLGIVEIDDQAAAMRQFAKLPFVDGSRIGIEGTSYGGYASAMAIVRYPDVFAAACASSSVTTWENYDSIYTERYMDTPQRNPEGYKAGSAMTYAKQLSGKLCLFYGTADDNVHPSNSHQLIQALDKASKPYRLYVGIDQGHAGLRDDRQLEFFMEAFGMLKQ
jgi:dipeptidyl-peptidase 4